MHKFVYVHAIFNMHDGLITFFSTSFMAVNTEQAYSIGHAWKQENEEIKLFVRPLLGYSSNDLVVRV